MSSVIGKGGNVALGGGRLHVTVAPAGIDLSVLCVRDHGKVGDDSEFVFYNQPVSPDGAVRLTDGAICIDLPNVGAVTDRLVVAASVDNGVFGGIPLAVRITEDGGLAHDLPITGLSSETTVILGEVYRRASGWKLRNVAQGYSSGLAGLATDFGISVDDEPPSANQNAAQPFSSPSQSAVPHTPAFGQPQVPPTGSPGTSFSQPPAGSPHAASFGQYRTAPQSFPPPPAGATPGATPDSHQRAFPPSAAPHGMHPQTPPPPGVNFSKGAVTLTKNAPPVLLEKSPVIRLRVAWASGTDYEAYALVVLNTGEVVHVATFDAKDTPANPHYRDLVRHLGDRGRGHVRSGGGQTEEIIEVRFAPEIVAIVPVAYSAINNGTGSFFKYRVSLAIENGADQVVIPADQAKKSSWIFTCVPGIVYNRPEGVLIERLELYSKRFSEFRPAAFLQPDGRVEVKMDKGPINQFKADRS
ncbi:Stress response protein SCP2 [Nocardia amikacinitolerans]|uniref:Stress response protein SCP2 n=1 Tax=Nocardia amikacinitolerans TaxID=756689 RepID=A0A285L677_9NOCA|nr:TerD family protein [Nocardia amikacinitolerans]SNY80450.1 Stress response protein SCP2 [Nocardia amikacinitolerans]